MEEICKNLLDAITVAILSVLPNITVYKEAVEQGVAQEAIWLSVRKLTPKQATFGGQWWELDTVMRFEQEPYAANKEAIANAVCEKLVPALQRLSAGGGTIRPKARNMASQVVGSILTVNATYAVWAHKGSDTQTMQNIKLEAQTDENN